MKAKIEKILLGCQVTLGGKKVNARHGYIIKISRVLRKPRYVRLNTPLSQVINGGEYISISLTVRQSQATVFREGENHYTRDMAEKITNMINNEPDRFVIN